MALSKIHSDSMNSGAIGTAQLSATGTPSSTTYLAGSNAWAEAAGVPAGTVIYYAASSAPYGYVKANGATVSRAAYAALFTALGTTFGVGDGSTTFTLPDLRGEFLRCWDDAKGTDSGRNIGTSQGSGNLAHSHTIYSAPHTGGYQYGIGQVAISRGYPLNIGGGPYSHVVNGDADGIMSAGTLTNSDSGTTEARPRNMALLACIKF